MRCPDRAENEADRLRALAEYGLNPQAGLPSLDPIVDLAARLFDCPVAAVNMIGDEHVFLAANHGIGECDLRRDVSFCAHAINQDEVMVVEDATLDPRFHDNPIVLAGLIRFYAGVALRSPSGHALGALCVIDGKPRAGFTQRDRAQLRELAGMVSDKLELRRIGAVAELSPNRFEASAATSPKAILCFDETGLISTCNTAACLMFDRSLDQMVGQSIDVLIEAGDRALAHSAIARVRGGGLPLNVGTPMIGLRRDGTQFPGELHWSRWYEGEDMHFGVIVEDMTEKRREHDALYHLANYDALTDLPNRNLLHRRMEEALVDGQGGSVIFTDLDGLTDINNTLGHGAGDRVLALAAEQIRAALPETAFLARVGDAEFATLLTDTDPAAIGATARAINAAVARPILVDGHEVRLVGSSGMAIAPEHGQTAEALMGSAELALFHAYSTGRGATVLYMPSLRAEAVARRMYDAELHRAWERKEFVLFYQPQVRLDDGSVTGAEALIRWRHPVRGLLPPAAFLPALEASVLAASVGQWVIETACAQAALWRRSHPQFRMSVNLSAAQLREGDLPTKVAAALSAHGLPPEALELEITENIILDHQETMIGQLEQLRALGVVLSFDDFGTGFASLNLLRNFPVSQIKIDKGFTQLMQTSAKDRVIVVGLINMAHQLGLTVVAEGIENRADAEFLGAHGCEKGQGYAFGKPVPAALFAECFCPRGEDLRRA
ncbi:putative bifunctional diguanylate cyclase/phosphodiesterase [Novosphingobium sp. JCM 18896]|uniref:putative bifunctional diguanylate cyclase/phosphodiesterase n=1 Tax=Novosphingobium sp. JCM 18896 TaxID=2989731 RepID=UPI0022222F2E|nr:EAL domain-containing protein [Novosphingobium sp. JCM 18896]MCW1429993.1 EAL domain-containing protein [Novosphingobium sp. JCM 18896]